MKPFVYSLLLTVVLIFACRPTSISLATAYQSAIQSSMYPDSAKIINTLVDIVIPDRNEIRRHPADSAFSYHGLTWKLMNDTLRLLTVTWKKKNFYDSVGPGGPYNTGSWLTWVTTAPELQDRMRKEKGTTDIQLRLRQLLGLPPKTTADTVDYKYFIEFWVRPEDLFRPCPDKEITDRQCALCATPITRSDTIYQRWIDSTRIERYYACGLYNQYPWTELGYTYDWHPANKKHIGLSEFVIQRNSNLRIGRFYTTEGYLGNGDAEHPALVLPAQEASDRRSL